MRQIRVFPAWFARGGRGIAMPKSPGAALGPMWVREAERVWSKVFASLSATGWVSLVEPEPLARWRAGATF